jgi:serine/threonine protein kinase/tetratricopeptide (TPR) repeat protein/TolB-like protein
LVGTSVGPYLVVERLGAGGMGEVFLAFDTRLNRKVALKSLSDTSLGTPETRERLLREARAAAKLGHPNIAGIHDILESGERPCIVMEFVQGETLSARIRRGPVALAQAVSIGVQLADALAHAHAAGVIHRDLKPGNVVLTPEGIAKILDFGLAKTHDVDPAASHADQLTRDTAISHAGKAAGTPAYMAPEQFLGRPATPQTDVYGLGVLLFETLSGRRPYQAPDFVALALAIASEPVPAVDAVEPSVPPEVGRIVARAMAKEPGDRYESAGALAEDLKRAQRMLGEGVTREFELPSSRSGRSGSLSAFQSSSRRRVAAAAVGAALLLGGVALGMWLWRRPPPATRDGRAQVVLVLPLANVSGDPVHDHVGVGISEWVLASLLNVTGVTVIPGIGVGKDLTRSEDTRKIAGEQGATLVFGGSVQQADQTVMFTARLVGADGTLRWARNFAGSAAEQFALYRDVADKLVEALDVSVTPEARERFAKAPAASVDAYADYALGLTLLERRDVSGNIDKAIDALERAIRKDASFALARAALADACLARFKDSNDASWMVRAGAASEEALRLDPASPRIQVSRASVLLESGRTEQAAAMVRQAIATRPNDDESHRLLAKMLEQQGQFEAAEAEFRQAITIRPDYWRNHSALGAFYWRANRLGDAIGAFKRVTDLQPDNAWGYLNLGATYQKSGENAQALVCFQRALAIGPDDFAYSNIGTIHYDEGRYEEAARAYEAAIRINPRDPATHSAVGDAYSRLGRKDQALTEYRRAADISRELLAVNPRDAVLLVQHAVYEAKTGMSHEATTHATAALALAPGNNIVLYKVSVVYSLSGRPADAVKTLKLAIEKGYSRLLARRDLDLDSIRTRPDVQALLRDPR